MAAITFDTLRFANRLEKAGISREHAQAEAEALADVFESGAQDLATKADLREMEQRLDGRMREMKAEIGGEFKRIDGRLNLQQWMLALVVAAEVVPLLAKFFGH